MPQYAYCGFGMPDLALYADGHQVVRLKNKIYEKTFSSSQVTTWIAHVRDSGFFQLEHNSENFPYNDMLYEIPTNAPFTMGAPSEVFYVENSGNGHSVYISAAYKKYLTQQARRAITAVTNFDSSQLSLYTPKQMILWIEEFQGSSYCNTGALVTKPWPKAYLPLSALGLGHVILDRKQISQISSLFDELPGEIMFQDGKKQILVIARPLLPDESPVPSFWVGNQ